MRLARPVIPALAAAGLLVATLAGCSTPEKGDPSDAIACAPEGSASKSISVKAGASADAAPKVTFDSPLKADKTETSVITKGSGANIAVGQTAKVRYTLVNGTSGETIGALGYDGTAAQSFPVSDSTIAGFKKVVLCAKPGARVAGVIVPDDAFGSAGNTELGVKGTDLLVMVADVVGIVKDKADGKSVDPGADFPKVTLKKSGEPEVELPKDVVEPATTLVGQLKQGDGATVAEGDTVTVQYKGIDWNTGKTFDASWSRGSTAEFPTTGVIAGFSKALVGQKVGSQVIAIIPPAEGYGPSGGQASAGIAATDTLIFVVDILDTGATSSTQG